MRSEKAMKFCIFDADDVYWRAKMIENNSGKNWFSSRKKVQISIRALVELNNASRILLHAMKITFLKAIRWSALIYSKKSVKNFGLFTTFDQSIDMAESYVCSRLTQVMSWNKTWVIFALKTMTKLDVLYFVEIFLPQCRQKMQCAACKRRLFSRILLCDVSALKD